MSKDTVRNSFRMETVSLALSQLIKQKAINDPELLCLEYISEIRPYIHTPAMVFRKPANITLSFSSS